MLELVQDVPNHVVLHGVGIGLVGVVVKMFALIALSMLVTAVLVIPMFNAPVPLFGSIISLIRGFFCLNKSVLNRLTKHQYH